MRIEAGEVGFEAHLVKRNDLREHSKDWDSWWDVDWRQKGLDHWLKNEAPIQTKGDISSEIRR